MTELDVLHAAEVEVRAEVERKEAEVRESAFLGALGEAQSHFRWLVDHQGWRLLGWDSFAAWWDGKVQPVMQALDARPTREIAAKVIEMVRAEEADLPPAQRRTQRELGELVGVGEATVGRIAGSRSSRASNDAGSDLGHVQIVQPAREGSPAGAGTEATPEVPAAEPATSSSPVAGSAPQPSDAVTEYLDADPQLQRAKYLHAFMKALTRSDTFMEFEPEKLAELADDDLVTTIDNHLIRVRNFTERFHAALPGLRAIDGGRS